MAIAEIAQGLGPACTYSLTRIAPSSCPFHCPPVSKRKQEESFTLPLPLNHTVPLPPSLYSPHTLHLDILVAVTSLSPTSKLLWETRAHCAPRPSRTTPPPQRQQQHKQLLDWLQHGGARIEGASILPTQDRGLSLVATKNLQAGYKPHPIFIPRTSRPPDAQTPNPRPSQTPTTEAGERPSSYLNPKP